MARPTTRGTCKLCGRTFGKGAILRHLEACRQKQGIEALPSGQKPQKARLFHLQVQGRYAPDYCRTIG